MKATSGLKMNENRSVKIGVGLVVVLVLGLVTFYPTEERKHKRLEKEFREVYSFDVSTVAVQKYTPGGLRKFIDKGHVTLRNKSDHDWKSISLILNPTTNFLGTTEGFRAPKESDKIFIKLLRGQSMDIPYEEFVHTETREKFSLDRYELALVRVRVKVPYKGDEFYCEKTFEW